MGKVEALLKAERRNLRCLPVNLSGGLVSKGHPVGATGLSMIYELMLQLRGEAKQRQSDGAKIAWLKMVAVSLGLTKRPAL